LKFENFSLRTGWDVKIHGVADTLPQDIDPFFITVDILGIKKKITGCFLTACR
jgi:hypothetical protein